MKLFGLFAVIFLITQSIFAREISPLGIWLVGDQDAKVELYMNKGNLEGKLVWLKEPLDTNGAPKLDLKNPDSAKQAQQIMGSVFLKNFKKDSSENKWIDGSVYDAKSGKAYSGWIKLKNENKMELRGFIGISLFGRTDEWTRDTL